MVSFVLASALAIVSALAIHFLRGRFLLLWFVSLPGVILHELAHFLVALLTFGRPSLPHIWPRKASGGYVLGSVQVAHVRWYNGLLIGLAPLLLIPLAVWILLHLPPRNLSLVNLWRIPVAGYLAGVCVMEAWPSAWDWRIARRSAWVVLGLLFLFLCWKLGRGGG